MLILSIPKMVVSSQAGWTSLKKRHPTLLSVFMRLALPLSLLPPVMLAYVGPHYGNMFVDGLGSKNWVEISLAFFIAEMTTLLFMGWFIKQVADTYRARVSTQDAYILACIAPVPLWLSSLALFVPSLAFNIGIAFVALGATLSLIYHGIHAICHARDALSATAIAQTVMGAGMAGWAVLLTLLLAA
ncbi:MAG: DUF1282 family protein [Burkholderiaceae bacterium]|nr:DUF1282 family protein [Burkholderiaceae bacterium]